ncbi:MAG: lacA 4 [Lachnospiraceae bacterium]|jgi:acetyltransferase-like isoleucine patch superfamily enzyme|nr:lacA 4 [Lachnospiraceae bacterium]
MRGLTVQFDKLRRYYRQIKIITIRDGWKKARWLKKNKIFYHIGDHCYFAPNILPAEPFLVSLHNNVVISAGVRLITHSVASAVFNYEEGTNDYLTRFGKVEIHDNVYIGANVCINPGVTIEKNCIVAAGAVITKNIPEGTVVGGVPAVKIGEYEAVKKKTLELSKTYVGITSGELFVKDLLKINPIVFDIDILKEC